MLYGTVGYIPGIRGTLSGDGLSTVRLQFSIDDAEGVGLDADANDRIS